MNVIEEARHSPYFQRRAFRLRRRNDEVRRKARLRRYWRAIGFDEVADQDRVPDPRECSCFLCRSGHMERVKYREAISPQIDQEAR